MIVDPSGFGVTAPYDGQSTVLSLRGRIEHQASFELDALLEAIVNQHPESLVLDLSELEFVEAAGLVAISNAERRFADLGTTMTVRSASALVNRVLTIMETAEASRLERALPGHERLGPEDLNEMVPAPTRSDSQVSDVDLRRVTAMPADTDVVDGALRLVVELALSCVNGADGVSVSLLRHGVLSTVAASDQTITAMDADQYATGEGPCVDASIKGHWFYAASLDTETRWPSFTPRARSLGIKAILSSPLTASARPVGALNIYSRTAETFEVKDQETAAVFADKASVILSDARAGVTDTQIAVRFKGALRSRDAIAMAQGVAMERYGFDEDTAFAALLRLSLDQGEPLRNLAETMVSAAGRPEVKPTEDTDG
ncbi:MAG TPA: ANTAR domain-containing protein [Acidimicrobiales bacterium]|jgi:anti-anti-sigma factor